MSEPLILITGASGYLGRHLVSLARERARVGAVLHRSLSIGRQDAFVLDIAHNNAVRELVESLQPSAIVHTAAVNPGQGTEEEMFRTNADGARNIAEAAVAVGARLIAVSTDIVHDGTAGPYADDAPATPINAYGRSKAAGEEAILDVDPSAVVVRTSLMYGFDEMDRGTATFAERLARGEMLSLFSDVIRNPIHVDVLADALLRLTGIECVGLLNVAGVQALSREDFGREMLRYWGVEGDGLIRGVRAADVSDSIPIDVRLDSSQAEGLLDMTFPGVNEAIATVTPG